MFSFHKPRVYRSTEGCCICRAKSSSSRFTDSKKYEDDSMKCFNLEQPRKGEICNACVLLVKRFKRLPVGSNRHWGHVVDARIGPGLKSVSKFKKHKDDTVLHQQQISSSDNKTTTKKLQNNNCKISSSSIPEKFCKIFKKTKKKPILRDKNKCNVIRGNEKRVGTPASWDEQSLPPTPESFNSDLDEAHQYSAADNHHKQRMKSNLYKIKNKINRRKLQKPNKRINLNGMEIANFFDENDWKRLKSCCGIVFENKLFNALIIDIQSYKPCPDHISLLKDSSNINHMQVQAQQQPNNLNVDFIRKTQQTVEDQQSTVCAVAVDVGVNVSVSREEQTQTPLSVLKKHQLFLKRQIENFPRANNQHSSSTSTTNFLKTDLEIMTTTTNNHNLKLVRQQQSEDIIFSSSSAAITTTDKNFKLKTTTIPPQIRSDTEKIIKHSTITTATTDNKLNILRVKQSTDIQQQEAKGAGGGGLIKINDKSSIKPKSCVKLRVSSAAAAEPLCNKRVDPSNTKFSDNSSDSGFDENLLEKRSSSSLGEEDKKLLIQPVQTMFLASGVQICGQQQNLILTGNDVAARMLHQRRQSQIIGATKVAQTLNNGCQKVSAIFNHNQSTERGGLITLTTTTTAAVTATGIENVGGGGVPTTATNIITAAAAAATVPSSTVTNLTHQPTVASLNQKIILVKAKYSNNHQPSMNKN